MKDDAIVVAILAVRSEVFTGFGCDVSEEVECDGALGSFEYDFQCYTNERLEFKI